MAVALKSLRITAGLDASEYARGAQQKADADAKMIASGRSVAASEAETQKAVNATGAAVEQTDRKISASTTGIERFKRAHVEGYAAVRDFERGLLNINKGLETNGINIQQAGAAVESLTRKYGVVAGEADAARLKLGADLTGVVMANAKALDAQAEAHARLARVQAQSAQVAVAGQSQQAVRQLLGVQDFAPIAAEVQADYANFWKRVIDQQQQAAVAAAGQSQKTVNELLGVRHFASLSREVEADYSAMWGRLLDEQERAGARAAQIAANENAKLAAAYGQVMSSIDPVIAQQQRYDRALADLRAGAAAAGRSAQELAQDEARLAAAMSPSALAAQKEAEALEALKARVDPASASLRRLADDQKSLDAARASGKLNPEEYATYTEAITRHRTAVEQSTASQKAMTNAVGLNKAQMQALSPQINDVVSGLIMGQQPMQIFTQQSGQIVQALQAGGAEMPKFKASTLAMAGAFGIAAAGAAVLVTRMVSISGEGRRLDETIRTLNPNLTATAEQLRQIAFDVADQQGVSRADAMGALEVAIKNTRIQSTALLKDITGLSVDISAVMGGEAADWAEKISDAAKRGSAGFSELASQLPGITADTLAAARAAEQHGDRMKALELIFGDLEKRWGGASRAMKNDFSEALRGMWNAWDEFVERWAKDPRVAMGARIVGQMITWVTPATQDEARAKEMAGILEALDAKTAQLQDAVSRGQSGPGVDLLRKQVTELQAQYYGLAQAATAATAATQATNGAQAAGGPAAGPSNDNKPNGLTETEQDRINRAKEATERWAEAMRKTGAARQVAVAGVEAYNSAIERGATEEVAKAERAEAERRARISLSASIADNSAQLTVEARESLKVADAYMQSAAAGQAAEAMRQAQLDSLQSGVSVEQRYQEILNERAATQAATTAQALQTYQQEVAGREAVANATLEGVDAAYKAEMAEKVRIGTLAETIALENASGEAAEKLRTIIEAKTAAILDDERAQKKQQVAQAIQQQKDQLELGQAQLRLMGASAEQRSVEIARLQALVYLRNQHIDALSSEGQAYITNAENTARQSLETERLNAAYQELERFGDQAFSSIIDAVVKGGDATGTWKNAVKGLVTEFETLALKMAVLNPIKNAVFGSNLPTLFDFTSMAGGSSSAANQNGGMGGLTGKGLSLGSKFIPSSWTNGITSSIDSWGYSSLGIGSVGGWASAAPASVTAATAAPITGAASANAATGVAAAGNTATANTLYSGTTSGASGAGVTGGLTSYLGALGAGFAAGGLIGPLLANGNKAVGGLAGGASGAAAGALVGSIVPGVGTLIGALLGGAGGGLGGLLGTQKPTVGKTASADVTVGAGGVAGYGNILTDNSSDPEAGKALGQTVAAIFNAAQAGGGTLAKDFGFGQTEKNGFYIGGSVEMKEFGDRFGDMMRYALLEKGGLQDGGPNVLAAIRNSQNQDATEFGKDVALGAAIDAGNTALQSMVKTLGGVTDAAKKATTDSLAPMFEELSRAQKLGIDGAYKSLATDQLKAYLDQLRNPPNYTQTEQDMAALKGQFQAAREAYAQLNPEMVTYVDQIERETRARVAANLNRQLDQQIAEASGRGYVNQISGFIDTLDQNARSLAAVGEPAARANSLFNASLVGVLRTLTTDQLSDVVRTFGGDIGLLAQQIGAANDNVTAATAAQEQTTRFETLIGQIRQDNINAEISALNEQKSAANSLLSSWKNVVSGVSQARQSLLVGDLSALDPRAKMDTALAAYRDALGRAQGGDVDAAGQVAGLAQTALQAAKAYYASNEDYARIFNEVTGGLGSVESAASRQVSLQSATVSRLDNLIGVQQEALRASQVNQADLRALLAGLNSTNSGDIGSWATRQDAGTQAAVKRARLEALGNADIERLFGGFSDIQAARAADPSFNLASWFKGAGINEVMAGTRPIPGFAVGTDYAPGGLAWVGERGPELMQLPTGSRIYPHSESVAIANSWGAANDRFGGSNVVPYQPARSSGSAVSVDVKGLERRLDDLIDLNKAIVVENSEVKAENRRLRTELSKFRSESADRDARPRRTGTYGQ